MCFLTCMRDCSGKARLRVNDIAMRLWPDLWFRPVHRPMSGGAQMTEKIGEPVPDGRDLRRHVVDPVCNVLRP